MDQDAFRSLLTRPREGGPSRSNAVLGRAPPKRGWDIKRKEGADKKYTKKDGDEEEEDGSRPAFAPRAHAKKVHEAAKYKDRAALRRAGGDGEYKEVEHLLEEFERRKVEAGDDADKVEAQRGYLGGDAEHSVLVKGLDYALLARRKAEIEAERAAGMDDELDQLGQGISTSKGKEKVVDAPKEPKSNRFKTIGKQEALVEKRRKKRDKVVEREEAVDKAPKAAAPVAPSPVKPPSPPDPEDEEDIFADAGEYDLKAGREDDDDENNESEEEGQMEVDSLRGRSRSRSADRYQRSYSREDSRDRNMRSRSTSISRPRDQYATGHQSQNRYRSTSRAREYSRSRSRSRGYRERSNDYRGRYDYGDLRHGERSRYNDDEDHDRRRRDRSWGRQGGRGSYDDQRSNSRRHDDGHRYRNNSRDRDYGRHGGRSGTGSGRWHGEERGHRGGRAVSRSRSRSPRGHRERGGAQQRSFSPSPSRSPSPPRRAPPRQRSRSPTPLLQQTLPFERSPTPENDDDQGPVTRLQPLASSAITDLRGFLAADEAGAKADARRLNKARWRAAQGLSLQDGVDVEALQRNPNEKAKANREYQVLMNRIGKDKDKGEGGGGGEGPSDQS